jgi:hypothetical protein
MEEKFGPLSLIQLVKFPTWSCVINNVKKCSILDHVYTNDKTLVKNLSSFEPHGGDHLVVTFDLKETLQNQILLTRDLGLTIAKIHSTLS